MVCRDANYKILILYFIYWLDAALHPQFLPTLLISYSQLLVKPLPRLSIRVTGAEAGAVWPSTFEC